MSMRADAVREVRNWMYRNARPLELAKWQLFFEDGDREPVLTALAAFQNEDGGFGHALEADNWNPASTPYAASIATEHLRSVGLFDKEHAMVKRLLGYLEETLKQSENPWTFTAPTNDAYPHAPWMGYSEKMNEEQGFNPAATLAGYVLRTAPKTSPLYAYAQSIADKILERLESPETLDMHEVLGYLVFLRDVEHSDLGVRVDCAALREKLRAPANAIIERDPAKWAMYSLRPSAVVHGPDDPFYPGNEDVIKQELTYLVSTRMPGGVWEITWKWAGYEKEFAVSRVWWQGCWAILNMLTLRAFGWAEGI